MSRSVHSTGCRRRFATLAAGRMPDYPDLHSIE